MKQITLLCAVGLLCAPLAIAAPKNPTLETHMPEATEIQDVSPATPAKPADLKPDEPFNAEHGKPAGNQSSEISNYANYRLEPGDTVDISVWKEDGLQQQQFLISPDGSIIYPLVGTVVASGKTITELKDALVTRLADYISDPSITVKILNNSGNTVFVIGKVNKPGQYATTRKIDVMQAISLAGGLTVYANESGINVMRRIAGELKVFPFDYSDVIQGEELQQNILLEPGDTITVP